LDPDEARGQRQDRVRRAIEEAVDPTASIQIPDLGQITTRDHLVAAAVTLPDRFDEVTVSFEQPDVRFLQTGQEASVHARATVTGRSARQGLVTDTREVRLRFARADGAWRAISVAVAPPSTVEPEARP
jgi:hypothetical protein